MNIPYYIRYLKPYVPGKSIEEIQREFNLEKVYKLASNENPLGPSPLAVEAMTQAMNNLNRYPDVGALKLREKIAEKFNKNIDNIIVGSGSEGIMAVILRSFLSEGEEMISSKNTFIGFQVLARGRNNNYVEVPMKDETYEFDLDRMKKLVSEKTKIIYLCNPNNPTGTIIRKNELLNFLNDIPETTFVLIDEAYFEYAREFEEYPDSLEYDFPNLITLRTFSKVYGIAGIRIGYGFATKEIVEILLKVKLPFEPNNLAQEGAIAALDDFEFIEKSLKTNREGYRLVSQKLTEILKKTQFKFVPSYANFVMIDLISEDNVNYFNSELIKRGIIIRPLKPFGLSNCIRVTIGTEEENKAFLKHFEELLSEWKKLQKKS
ncbi:MAG: histidinol-phosphate transaminase [Ignavibacteria bacterium]